MRRLHDRAGNQALRAPTIVVTPRTRFSGLSLAEILSVNGFRRLPLRRGSKGCVASTTARGARGTKVEKGSLV